MRPRCSGFATSHRSKKSSTQRRKAAKVAKKKTSLRFASVAVLGNKGIEMTKTLSLLITLAVSLMVQARPITPIATLAERLGFVDAAHLHDAHGKAETLARKLSSFKRSLTISHMP